MSTTTTEIIKVEEITSIMANAGDTLLKNQALTAKAENKIIGLLDTIEGQGMSDELDKELNDWQVNAKKALQINYDRRTPITQMANQVVKAFTACEAPLDPAKKDSYYTKAQQYRNSWAAKKVEEQRKKEEEIRRQQELEKEKITVKAQVEEAIRLAYQDYLLKAKQYLNTNFERITLENFAGGEKWLKEYKCVLKLDVFEKMVPVVNAVYLTPELISNIILNVKTPLFTELAANFRECLEETKQLLIDRLPSKKAELEEIAKAGEEQRKELEAQAEKRRKEEEERLQREAEEAKAKEAAAVSEKKEAEQVNTLFDAQAQLAEVQSDSKHREGFSIEVKNYAGWMQISAFWFEREGKNTPADKFEKKTLGQMKTFAEKCAAKDPNDRIVSNHLVYHEVFKAVTVK